MRFFIVLILGLLTASTYGQFTTPEVISSGGDSYVKPFAKMEVTIGEPVTETFSGNDIIFTQGFQQSHFFAVTIEENTVSDNIDFNVYPNPAIDELNIIWNIDEPAMLFLYDLIGNLILSDNLIKHARINISGLAAGAYLLRFSEGNIQKTVIIQKLK